MDSQQKDISGINIAKLKSRWHEHDPENGVTLRDGMLKKLTTDCRKDNCQRPLNLDLRGIDLINLDLSDLDLSMYDLSHASLNKTDFSRTNLSYATLTGVSLEKAILDECEFIGSDLSHANLNECSAARTGFGAADLSNSSMINANLNETTLSRSKLNHADLRAATIKNSRLSEADLSHAIFTRASLKGSDLKNAQVHNTNFELADMQGCRLLGIKGFQKASWIGTDIRGMDLRGAYLVRRFIADENYLYEFKTRSRLHNAVYHVWWFTSDCGRSLLRWFFWLIIVTLMFALIYTQVDIDYGDHRTWFSPIYYSFVTLTTLGYGDVLPASVAGQIFVTIQAVAGYVGLGGLLSILGNKMARRAE